ncbi:MAG: traL [Candidatus Midichloriaceae bacterium]|nr:traL [Candidatus Midichloriaceae bacterium]
MGLESFYIPRTLDEPTRILFWSIDEALIMIAPTGLGIILGHTLIGMAIGMGCFLGWRKLKGAKQANYILYMAYWWLPECLFKFKKTPASYYRVYVG